VNVAAIVPFTPWDDITFEEWRRIMAVNLDSVFLTIKAVEKPMREAGYGRIVNIASNVVLAGTPNLAHYVASKGGVWSFTRAAARELGKHGITVNSVPPGRIISEQILRNYPPEFRKRESEHDIPVGEYGQPEDIAHLVCFLASPLARYITGAVIPVDGGLRRYQF
jgi:NAD(P)-dependent dehydrogenase (short-subunit alcohol dehydrogenase family)